MPAIICKQLSKTFKKNSRQVKALDELGFEVPESCIFGLAGINGAGKTTAIRVILNELRPDTGEVFVLGKPANETLSSCVGFSPEHSNLFDFLTVSETIAYSCSLLGKTISSDSLDQLLKELELFDCRNDYTQNLSKGQKQRVSLAAAIAHRPELIIFDEPTSGLDPLGRILVKNLIKQQKEAGATVFFSTHILTDLDELCDQIGILHKGKMVFCGNPGNLKKSVDAKSIEEAFIKTVNKLATTEMEKEE
jgi:ABC-2 type transport system ATP-binding protein